MSSAAERPKRRGRGSAVFQLSGMSADVERRWARMAPLVVRRGSAPHPRVRCLSLARTYVTEACVAELFAWPDAARAAEQLRDVVRHPEVLLVPAGARDGVRLAALGVVAPEDGDVVLLTVRGVALAFRALEADQRAADRTGRWHATAQTALRRLAAIQKRLLASEPLPTEPETRARSPLQPIDVSAMGEGDEDDIDPETVIPLLKRRRTSALKLLHGELEQVRAELAALRRRAEGTRSELAQMCDLLAASQ